MAEEHEHLIDTDELLDHASEQHQEVSRRLIEALNAEMDRDPKFCGHCAMIGISVARVVQLQFFIEIGSEHEKAELQPFLDDALRERLALPLHGASRQEA